MNVLSNHLADLAERVKEANRLAADAEQTGAECAMRAGSLLIEAKAAAGHGEWLPFLERAGVEKRKGQRLMQLAESGLNASSVTHLGGITPALAFLASWKLPIEGEALWIGSEVEVADDDEALPIAYVWREQGGFDVYNMAVLTSENVIQTKRPVLPRMDFDGEASVDVIIHWLELHLPVPIADWRIERVPRGIVDVAVFTRADA